MERKKVNMRNIELFEEELNLIKDVNLRLLTERMLLNVPEYFYSIAASSSGKYHPQYALGVGGLVRHTKAAIKIANSLLSLEQYSVEATKMDIIIMALLLHDSFKQGIIQSEYTVNEHPVLAASFVKHFDPHYKDVLKEVADLIKSHMGQWYDYKPQTDLQKFVHLCDYLASRKFLEVIFEEEED